MDRAGNPRHRHESDGGRYSVCMGMDRSGPAALRPLVQGLTVLVVDDDDDVRDAMRMVLEQAGARVLAARNGSDALDQLRAHIPDLILSDLAMPHVDGYQLLTRVRTDPAHASLPIIAVSAFDSPADRERTRRAGFAAHLGKPFNYADLADAFTIVMRRCRNRFTRQLARLRAFAKEQRRKGQEVRQRSRFAQAKASRLRSVFRLAGRRSVGGHPVMVDTTGPVAICSVCQKPLAELPAILRQGNDEYVHATCWSGQEPAEKPPAEGKATTDRAA